MRRIRKTLAAVLLTAAALLGIPAATAAAPAPYGPPVPLLSKCGNGYPADATIAADGTVRGFSTCGTLPTGTISYFRYRGGTAFSQPTPYRGMMLKAAWDSLNSTYLLFSRPGPDPTTEQLFIGKRLDNTGQYAPATLLTTTHPSGPEHATRAIQASLVASASRWWAIWTEPTTGVRQPATYSLFQRHTLLGVQPRTRISYPLIGVADSRPSLAYSAGLLTAIWGRAPDQGPGTTFLMLGQSRGPSWGARPLWSGPANFLISTDLIQYVGIRYATWLTTWQVSVAANLLAPFYARNFPVVNGAGSTIAVSGRNLFVMWWTAPGMGTHVALVEREAGVWSSPTNLEDASSPVRVLAQGGKGRLVYWSGDTLTLRIQN